LAATSAYAYPHPDGPPHPHGGPGLPIPRPGPDGGYAHDQYFQYINVPEHKVYEMGYRRGNPHHNREQYLSQKDHTFKAKVGLLVALRRGGKSHFVRDLCSRERAKKELFSKLSPWLTTFPSLVKTLSVGGTMSLGKFPPAKARDMMMMKEVLAGKMCHGSHSCHFWGEFELISTHFFFSLSLR